MLWPSSDELYTASRTTTTRIADINCIQYGRQHTTRIRDYQRIRLALPQAYSSRQTGGTALATIAFCPASSSHSAASGSVKRPPVPDTSLAAKWLSECGVRWQVSSLQSGTTSRRVTASSTQDPLTSQDAPVIGAVDFLIESAKGFHNFVESYDAARECGPQIRRRLDGAGIRSP